MTSGKPFSRVLPDFPAHQWVTASPSIYSLIRQAYLELAMLYLYTSENEHSVPCHVPDNADLLAPLSEREGSMSIVDDASSVSSAVTGYSSKGSTSKAKRKV